MDSHHSDKEQHRQLLAKAAAAYGLEHEPDLERYFELRYEEDGRPVVTPALPGMVDLTGTAMDSLMEELHPAEMRIAGPAIQDTGNRVVVIRRHKYYRYLQTELYSAGRTKDGRLKNPLTPLAPLELVWMADDPAYSTFYTALAMFQQHRDGKRTPAELSALRTLVRNEPGYDFYLHDESVTEKVSANSLNPVMLAMPDNGLKLVVHPKGPFYEISGHLSLHGKDYPLHTLKVTCTYFLQVNDTLFLPDNLHVLVIADLFTGKRSALLIHAGKYKAFKQQFLDKLDDVIQVNYTYLKPGSVRQLEEGGFTALPEKLIYLSDFGQHVMIIPVMRYGEAEVAIRTRKQVQGVDSKGKEFAVPRNEVIEDDLIGLVLKQHPYFPEQLENQLYYFYLHKRHFLNEDWFLPVFEAWQEAGIAVMGFNELSGNNLNAHRAQIDIKVISGLNWFNVTLAVRFGKTKAKLKQIQAALRNKRKYVQLDDGTRGILPAEWIEKFFRYFTAGEVVGDEVIQIAKANFETLEELYGQYIPDGALRREIQEYRERLGDLTAIPDVPVPAGLQGSLRPYQQQGLNWLSRLDELHFGGCLADDMGLGKTVQIIAFILSQRGRVSANINLVVVPASLIFNWQQELAAFAPSIRVYTLYGSERKPAEAVFDGYEVVLTSYTTLLSDIRFLKKVVFNYIFLDESQQIKNPTSQRYKAVCLLQARNKIALTGTPFENNSFDLYGQLSVVCPGLLGDKRYFRDVYAKPIDQFSDKRRKEELQRKIRPFILRRTKQQVASELPERAEMVLYCEMGEQQRGIYDAYEREFREYISALSGDELDRSPMNVLRGLTRLRQICNSPALLPDGMLNTAVSAKLEMLKEQVVDKAPHHKLLVFSQFVSMLSLVRKELDAEGIRYVILTGSTRDRGAVVRQFQEDPGVRVFLISLKAGGTGLNLTAADYVYLIDPWWNPAVENQAIDRTHRIGQDKKVVAVRLVTPNTIEEKIAVLQQRKSALADSLVQADGSFFRSLSREELLGLLT